MTNRSKSRRFGSRQTERAKTTSSPATTGTRTTGTERFEHHWRNASEGQPAAWVRRYGAGIKNSSNAEGAAENTETDNPRSIRGARVYNNGTYARNGDGGGLDNGTVQRNRRARVPPDVW